MNEQTPEGGTPEDLVPAFPVLVERAFIAGRAERLVMIADWTREVLARHVPRRAGPMQSACGIRGNPLDSLYVFSSVEYAQYVEAYREAVEKTMPFAQQFLDDDSLTMNIAVKDNGVSRPPVFTRFNMRDEAVAQFGYRDFTPAIVFKILEQYPDADSILKKGTDQCP